MERRPLSTESFDAFVDGLDYPLFIVTAYDGQERDGCLVGFATQASIDPPRLLVCLSRTNRTLRVAAGAHVLAVHVLDAGDRALAERFGGQTGDEADKFDGVRWHAGPAGVPLLDDPPRHVVGRVLERFPLGDHVGHLLEPIAVRAGEPVHPMMLHHAGDMEPGHGA